MESAALQVRAEQDKTPGWQEKQFLTIIRVLHKGHHTGKRQKSASRKGSELRAMSYKICLAYEMSATFLFI